MIVVTLVFSALFDVPDSFQWTRKIRVQLRDFPVLFESNQRGESSRSVSGLVFLWQGKMDICSSDLVGLLQRSSDVDASASAGTRILEMAKSSIFLLSISVFALCVCEERSAANRRHSFDERTGLEKKKNVLHHRCV
jgi:hypothetical protein